MRDKKIIKARTGGRRVDTCDHGLPRSSLRVKPPININTRYELGWVKVIEKKEKVV